MTRSIHSSSIAARSERSFIERKYAVVFTRLCYKSSRTLTRNIFLHNVKEHAPPLAGASFGRGVRVEITQEHVNSAASGGCVSRLVVLLVFWERKLPLRLCALLGIWHTHA